jgi:sortase system peptidoglycan-associated protein
MKKSLSQVVWTVGLVGMGAWAFAGPIMAAESMPGDQSKAADTRKVAPPQEPIGFVTGGVIGAFAGGPIGAVVGAGLGTWLGNRVHRASEAKKAEAEVASLQTEKSSLEAREAALKDEQTQLAAMNRSLAVQVEQLSRSVKAAQMAKNDPAEALDGLQGDVLFRTGSADVTPDVAHQIQVLAQAMMKSPELKIRVDGYADPRGTADANLKLSEARANAVRDLLMASGVSEQSLEINAYGKSLSVADDDDGYALERRVRLTLLDDGKQVASNAGVDPEGTQPTASAPVASAPVASNQVAGNQ